MPCALKKNFEPECIVVEGSVLIWKKVFMLNNDFRFQGRSKEYVNYLPLIVYVVSPTFKLKSLDK